MNVLLIGSGGREHALAWAITESPLLSRLFVALGNGGIAEIADCAALDVADHGAVLRFCRDNHIDFVVIGPEVPLVAGLGDDLTAAGISAFGPGREAALLEGSKGFTKEICAAHGIPTARFARFDNAAHAKAYAARHAMPVVVKADGLAAGKGVVVAETLAEAERAINACFGGAFGPAGTEVVMEEFLFGEEASYFALSDGETILPLATAQDHKRAFDGDEGPNTGGMGAYSPAPVMTEAMCRRTLEEIIRPTIAAMAERGTPYRGVLYAGLMITDEGPKLIEYNVRFGDPECQVLMMRLKDPGALLGALLATVEGTLADVTLDWRREMALTVVMATKGYPGATAKGSIIRGLEAAGADPMVEIFHAGTVREEGEEGAEGEEGEIRAVGGRVLDVTALGASVAEAKARTYEAIARIDWPEGYWRTDIGWRALAREEAA